MPRPSRPALAATLLALLALGAAACPHRGPGHGTDPDPGPAPPPPLSPEAQAAAQRMEALLYQAEQAYAVQLDLGAAQLALDEAIGLGRTWGIGGTPAARACALRGALHVWMGETAEAETLLGFAVTFDPTVRLPTGWDDAAAVGALEAARARATVTPPPPPPPPPPAAAVRHAPPSASYAGYPVPLFVEVRPDLAASGVDLYWRTPEFPSGAVVPMVPAGPGWYAELPCAPQPPSQWEYFLAVRGSDGNPVASEGSPEQPHRVVPARGAPPASFTYPDGTPVRPCP